MSEARRRRVWQLGAAGLFVAIVAGAAVAIFSSPTAVDLGHLSTQSRQVERLLAEIPQRGVELGDRTAPATLVEFVDPQCPFCGQFSRDVLPTVVRRYVRRGRIGLRLELLTILGDDSQRIARLAAAASLQDRGWDLLELAFDNQGDEGSGYATDDYLRRIARATPGLNANEAIQASRTPRSSRVLDAAARQASSLGVDSTPRFFVEQRGRQPREVNPSDLTPEAFSAALDSLLPR